MAGEMLNMSNLTIKKHRFRLKDLYSRNRHKPYTQRHGQIKTETLSPMGYK